jgi:hypothetical protein
MIRIVHLPIPRVSEIFGVRVMIRSGYVQSFGQVFLARRTVCFMQNDGKDKKLCIADVLAEQHQYAGSWGESQVSVLR